MEKEEIQANAVNSMQFDWNAQAQFDIDLYTKPSQAFVPVHWLWMISKVWPYHLLESERGKPTVRAESLAQLATPLRQQAKLEFHTYIYKVFS